MLKNGTNIKNATHMMTKMPTNTVEQQRAKVIQRQ